MMGERNFYLRVWERDRVRERDGRPRQRVWERERVREREGRPRERVHTKRATQGVFGGMRKTTCDLNENPPHGSHTNIRSTRVLMLTIMEPGWK